VEAEETTQDQWEDHMIKTTRRTALSMFAATAIGLVTAAGLSTAAQAADAIKIGILSLTSH
jgi:NitT/TauT family transport system substrate-binding protein